MFYLYGIARWKPGLALGVPGIGGMAVRMERWRGLMVAASPFETWEVEASTPNLWCHEHVIEAVMAQSAVIPLRFCTVVADLPACRQLLSRHYRQLSALLGRVNDRVEFALRLSGAGSGDGLAAAADPESVGPGTAYLRALARHSSAWPEALLAALRGALDPWALASMPWPRDTKSADLRASFLVERPGVDAFRREVAGFGDQRRDLTVSCTGPWPPYSFVADAFSQQTDRKAKR
ncbi:MAG TPA: GvpL/GvpF family gas vesicle protein [Rhodocyclaceae bacterium]|nr:GvpL/GvpF family gas vesicle protein [Rhodocyclaceae bacterium]